MSQILEAFICAMLAFEWKYSFDRTFIDFLLESRLGYFSFELKSNLSDDFHMQAMFYSLSEIPA